MPPPVATLNSSQTDGTVRKKTVCGCRAGPVEGWEVAREVVLHGKKLIRPP